MNKFIKIVALFSAVVLLLCSTACLKSTDVEEQEKKTENPVEG